MSITFDGTARIATLGPGTVELDVVELYSAWKLWVLAGNAQWPAMFQPVGGDDIDVSAGTRVPLYAFLLNGWRVRPQAANHTLVVAGGILLVDGGGDPFVNPLGGPFAIRISYSQPVQAITVATGGAAAGLTPAQEAMLADLAKVHGLIAGISLVVTPTSRVAGDLQQSISEAGGTVTVERVA